MIQALTIWLLQIATHKICKNQANYGQYNKKSLSCDPSLESHYNDVIMGTIASQITSLMIVYSTVNSDADQRKRQSSASLAFVRGIHRRPVNSPHKWPVSRNFFPFDDVIMRISGVQNVINQLSCLASGREDSDEKMSQKTRDRF